MGEPSARGTRDLRGNPLFLGRNEWRRVPFLQPPMKNAVKRAYRLADGQTIEVKTDGGRRRLLIPGPILDPTATVVVVEIEGDAVQR